MTKRNSGSILFTILISIIAFILTYSSEDYIFKARVFSSYIGLMLISTIIEINNLKKK